jgi:hypothetical protein
LEAGLGLCHRGLCPAALALSLISGPLGKPKYAVNGVMLATPDVSTLRHSPVEHAQWGRVNWTLESERCACRRPAFEHGAGCRLWAGGRGVAARWLAARLDRRIDRRRCILPGHRRGGHLRGYRRRTESACFCATRARRLRIRVTGKLCNNHRSSGL